MTRPLPPFPAAFDPRAVALAAREAGRLQDTLEHLLDLIPPHLWGEALAPRLRGAAGEHGPAYVDGILDDLRAAAGLGE